MSNDNQAARPLHWPSKHRRIGRPNSAPLIPTEKRKIGGASAREAWPAKNRRIGGVRIPDVVTKGGKR